jgi:hypothetical protein
LIAEKLNVSRDEPAALLFRDTAMWQPLLEPVMARLTSGVQWWQLGDEGDYSFLGRSQLNATIDEIRTKLQGYGPPIRIVLNWPWLDAVPDQSRWSWHAVCLSDPIAPTAREIDAFFQSRSEWKGESEGDATGERQANSTTPRDAAESSSPPRRDPRSAVWGTPSEEQSESVALVSRGLLEQSVDVTAVDQQGRHQRPWLVVNPLPHGAYTRSERVRDLILRMLAVRRHRVPAAFVSDPFDRQLRFLRPDGTPDEMLLPWRTAASLLAELRPVGSLDLPNGSPNVLLADDSTATLVVWTDRTGDTDEQTQTELIYLGPEARHLDAYGREIPIEQVRRRGYMTQQIRVTREPSFITGVDRTAALWWLGVKLDRTRIDSLLGREQTVQLVYSNPDSQLISGSVRIDAPEAWNIDDSPRPIAIEPLRQQRQQFSVTLRNDAKIGRGTLAIDFELDGDRRREFTVYRTLDIGPEDVHMEVTTRLVDGQLVVRHEITNSSDTLQRFDCFVYPPQRRRSRKFATVPAGATLVQEYWWADGEQLIGKTLRLRADQENGARTLNFEFIATP